MEGPVRLQVGDSTGRTSRGTHTEVQTKVDMGHRPVGHFNSQSWLPNRVHSISSFLGCKRNKSKPKAVACSTSRSIRTAAKRCNRNHPLSSGAKRVLLHLFRSPQKGIDRGPSHFEPQTSERICQKTTFSDGKYQINQKGFTAQRLFDCNRSQRCISSCTDTLSTSQVSEVQSGRSGFSIQSAAVRSGVGAARVHEDAGSDSGYDQTPRDPSVSIFGRLVGSSRGSEKISRHDAFYSPGPCQSRLGREPEKIYTNPHSKHGVYRGPFPNRCIQSISAPRQNEQSDFRGAEFYESSISVSQTVSEPARIDERLYRSGAVCSPDDAADTAVPPVSLAPKFQKLGSPDTSEPASTDAFGMVAVRGQSEQRRQSGGLHASRDHLHRCLRCRLGRFCGLRRSGTGSVVRDRPEYSHQSQRVGSCFQNSEVLSKETEKQEGTGEERQCHRSVLHKQTRGHQVSHSVYENMDNVSLVTSTEHSLAGSACKRGRECQSRSAESCLCQCPGVAAGQVCSEQTVSPVRQTFDRPVRLEPQHSVTDLLQPLPGPSGVSSRRFTDELGRSIWLCFPPDMSDSSGVGKNQKIQLHNSSDCPQVAKAVMVPPATGVVSGFSSGVTTNSVPADTKQRAVSSSQSSFTQSNSMEVERTALVASGIPDEAINTMLRSVRPNTRKTYDSKWACFSSWCAEKNVDPTAASLTYILGYLQSLLNKGLEYNTLCVHRSAISKYHLGLDGQKVGEHPQISKFMKGAFNVNPPKKVLLPCWDLQLVLEVLKKPPFAPLSSLSVKMLTLKTVFLLAITSARRCSELQALGRQSPFLRFEKYGVRFRTVFGFLSKTTSVSHSGEEIFLPAFCKYVKELCVVRYVKKYLAVTSSLISDSEDHLLVGFGASAKGRPVSPRTISGWLVRVIKMAYEVKQLPPPRAKAHSTRAQASSWALFRGASVSDIMKAADWQSSSTFVKHYNLRVWKKQQAVVGRTVLKTARKLKTARN